MALCVWCRHGLRTPVCCLDLSAVWQVDVRMLQDLLRAFQPELARVLEDVEVPLDLICSQWLLSLFSMNLPLDTCVAC